jgi:methionine synthase II (cobalamin-independent)
MVIPTEPIGSIPRPPELLAAFARVGDADDPALEPLYDAAVEDTIGRFEHTGSPVVTDDTSTTRETAFATMRARVLGTALAEKLLGAGS